MSVALSTSTVASQRGMERLLNTNHIRICLLNPAIARTFVRLIHVATDKQKFGQEAQEKEHN